MSSKPRAIGLLQPADADRSAQPDWLRTLWQDNLAAGYNMTLLPVIRELPASEQTLDLAGYENLPVNAFTRKAHSALSSGEWPSVTAVIPPGLPSPVTADVKNRMLEEAAQWAKYLGMQTLMLDLDWLPDGLDGTSASIALLLDQTRYEGLHMALRMPATEHHWIRWNALRNAIGPLARNRLHVVLDFSQETDESRWHIRYQRWFGESLQAISIPTTMFVAGPQGQPILPMFIAALLDRFLDYPGIAFFIDGPCLSEAGYGAYRDFLEKLESIHQVTELEQFLSPSFDHLLRPMQPLGDQLHSSFYELFEKDPVKYVQYEKAIAQALSERHRDAQPAVVMVLGAGRGPLVDRVINAVKITGVAVRIYVVEKNPTAVVTLQHRARDDWGDFDVTIVATDMRHWQAPEAADILVSELLGSWGDNELSPECLDGAIHLLKDSGISIPCAYTSWLAPVSSARLHAKVACLAPPRYPEASPLRDLESQYVVRIRAGFVLTPEQPCFTFEHPGQTTDNTRDITLTFTMPTELDACLIHGFRGTFHCTLYGSHTISIADKDHCPDMFSWAPLFIPLATPVTVNGGDSIDVRLWRKLDTEHVWYEWQVVDHTAVHNPDGRSATIAL